ncbi:MAG: fluoride efflux transporter CrcB [Thalassobaculales bacterium]
MLAWVALGSALGGAARFLVSGWIARKVGETFPWGTMAVNVTGAMAIGAMAMLADLGKLGALAATGWPDAWPAIVVGFLGSYTTVSSFSLQTLALARDGDWVRAGGNVALSLALCLGAVAVGYRLAAAAAGGPW